MSQVPDSNPPDGGQATPPPPYGQSGPPQPPYGQPQAPYGQPLPPYGPVNPQPMMAPAVYGMPGMTPSVPPRMYYDQASGLILPNGTTLASGRRVGAYFLAIVLWIVTLFIGYAIWGLITWADGRTPTQQVLGMRCWKPQTGANATWGTMFLRGVCMAVLDYIALGGLVSFIMFLVNKDRRTLYDHVSGVVELHDPGNVLSVRP